MGAVPRAEGAETRKWGRNMGGKTLSQPQRLVPKPIQPNSTQERGKEGFPCQEVPPTREGPFLPFLLSQSTPNLEVSKGPLKPEPH